MKLPHWIFFFSLTVFLFACSEEKKTIARAQKKDPEIQKQLINAGFFNEENLKNVSFPIWFNQDVTKSKKLKSLTFSYHVYKKNQTSSSAELSMRPKKERSFEFDKEGWVKKYVVKDFYDDKLISTSTFQYKSKPDLNGYSLPTVRINRVNDKNIPLNFLNSLDELLVYDRLELIESDSSYLKFKETFYVTSHEVLYLMDTMDQNIITIDKKFEPTKNDIIVYGSPIKPSYSCNIENTVEVNEIFENEFYGNNVIQSSELYEDIFRTKRNYSYSSKGVYLGYTDSIFAQSDLIKVENNAFFNDSLEIPYQIINTIVQNNGYKQDKSAVLVTFTTY